MLLTWRLEHGAKSAQRAVSASRRHIPDPPAKPGNFRLLAAAAARLRVRDPSCL